MGDDRRILIVFNPASGNGRGERTAFDVGELLKDKGIAVAYHPTSRSGDAEAAAIDAIKDGTFDCIAACGGDGTVQEVANALASTDGHASTQPALGVVPAGRCNDFARAIGLRRDTQLVGETLACGTRRPIDLGRVNGRFFCTIATLGIDAEITAFVDRRRLPIRGTLAYVYGALRIIMKYRTHQVRITGDFPTIEQKVLLASSANTASYGGSIHLVPQASPTDGILDLCIIDRVGRIHAIALLTSMLFGRHVKFRRVSFQTGRRFRIESPDTLEFWADGEFIATTPADVEIVPNAIEVLLPSA